MMLFLVVVLAQMPAPNAPNVDMSGVAIFEGGAFTRGTEWSRGGAIWRRLVCQ